MKIGDSVVITNSFDEAFDRYIGVTGKLLKVWDDKEPKLWLVDVNETWPRIFYEGELELIND